MDYPALTPETRTYTSGRIPIQRRDDLSGAAVRWIRGDVLVGHRLKLSYGLGTSLEARRILDHYRTVQGGFIPFKLPSAVWCGSASYPGSTVAGGLSWRYAAEPAADDVSPGTFSVEVELISVTSELPLRTVEPVTPTATTAIEVENDPAPPFEPVGPWFRAFSQSVLITSNDVLLSVPVRQMLGEPIVEVASGGSFAKILRFGEADTTVAVSSGVQAIFWDQKNNVTRQIPLPPIGLTTSDEIASVAPDPADSDWIQEASTQLGLSGLSGLLISEEIAEVVAASASFQWLLSSPTLLLTTTNAHGDGGGDYELDVVAIDVQGGFTVALTIALPVVVGSEVDVLDRSAAAAAIPFEATVGSLLDSTTRESQPVDAAISLGATSNPVYLDFGTGGANESTAFAWGPSAGPTDIPFDVLASNPVDMPRRQSEALSVAFPIAVGSLLDLPDRSSLPVETALSLLTSGNLAYVDFTSGSPDEDAGFKELGASAELALAFSIAVGSLLEPFTRAGTPLDIAFALTVGGDDDTPTRASQEASISSLDPGLTQPSSFSDLTP